VWADWQDWRGTNPASRVSTPPGPELRHSREPLTLAVGPESFLWLPTALWPVLERLCYLSLTLKPLYRNQVHMNTLPPRITMHLRPAVRRLTLSWILAVVIVAAMTVGMAYNARQVVGACWLAVAALFLYALSVLRRLRS